MENRSLTKTRAEVADEFGISPRTLRRWLSDLQITLPQRKYLLPEEYELLYQAIREMGKIDRRLNYTSRNQVFALRLGKRRGMSLNPFDECV